jgi:hypothetical protein
MPRKTTPAIAKRAAVSAFSLERRIYLIRGNRVMLDFDLADLYQIPTKRLPFYS